MARNGNRKHGNSRALLNQTTYSQRTALTNTATIKSYMSEAPASMIHKELYHSQSLWDSRPAPCTAKRSNGLIDVRDLEASGLSLDDFWALNIALRILCTEIPLIPMPLANSAGGEFAGGQIEV